MCPIHPTETESPAVKNLFPKTSVAGENALTMLLSPEVRSLLDHLSIAFQARAVFFDANGNQLLRGRELDNCRYCKMLQECPSDKERCFQLDSEQRRQARQTGKMIVYTCHANLTEAIAPVMIKDKCAGFVMIGQFRIAGSKPPKNLPSDVAKAFYEIPEIQEEKLEAQLALFRDLVTYIAYREFIMLPVLSKYELLMRYIDNHLTEDVTLPEAAAAVGMSVSGLTGYLRKNFNTSFKTILISKRIDLAADILRRSPALSIAEVAALAGYDDEFYFSRTFRKIKKISPGKYRTVAAQ